MKSLIPIGSSLVLNSIDYGSSNIIDSFSRQIELNTELKKIDLVISQKEYEINTLQSLYQEVLRLANEKVELLKQEVQHNKNKSDYKIKILEDIENNGTKEQYIDLLIKISNFNLKGE